MLVAFYGHPCMLKLCSVVKYFCEESVPVLTSNLTLILDYSHFHLHVSDFLWSPNPCMIKLYIFMYRKCAYFVLSAFLMFVVCSFVCDHQTKLQSLAPSSFLHLAVWQKGPGFVFSNLIKFYVGVYIRSTPFTISSWWLSAVAKPLHNQTVYPWNCSGLAVIADSYGH